MNHTESHFVRFTLLSIKKPLLIVVTFKSFIVLNCLFRDLSNNHLVHTPYELQALKEHSVTYYYITLYKCHSSV